MMANGPLGYYLGIPVLFICDHGDGWITVQWPDNEKPRKKRPFTFTGNGPDARRWKLWRAQVTFPKALTRGSNGLA